MKNKKNSQMDQLKKISIERNNISIEKIHSSIQKIGGENFIKKLLSQKMNYDREYDRYFQDLINKQFYIEGNKDKNKFPVHYLLNIGCKFLINNPKELNAFEENESLSTIEKEAYKLSENIFNEEFINLNSINIKSTELSESIFSKLYFDRIVSVNQYDFIIFKKIISQLFIKFEKLPKGKELDLKYYNTKHIILHVLNALENKTSIVLFDEKELLKNLKNNEKTKFRKNFTISAAIVNRKYCHPFDLKEINVFTKPFIRRGDEYILIDKNLSIFSLYNTVIDFLNNTAIEKNKTKNLEKKIGEWLEEIIFEELQFYLENITYGFDKEDLDYDLYFPYKKSGVIFELKKKALTIKSLNGNLTEIFNDLKISLFQSQLQLIKRKKILKNEKYLKLYKKKNSKNLKFEQEINHEFIRFFSLTVDNYNCFGEKTYFINLLKIFLERAENLELKHKKNRKITQRSEENFSKLKDSSIELRNEFKKYCEENRDGNNWDTSLNKNLLDIGVIDISTLFSLIRYISKKTKKENIEKIFYELIRRSRSILYMNLHGFYDYHYNLQEILKNEKP